MEVLDRQFLSVCLEIPRSAVYEQGAGWRGVKRLRGKLRRAGPGARGRWFRLQTKSRVGERWPQAKSPAASPLAIFRQTLNIKLCQ